MLSSIIVFSLLSYGTAFYQHRASLIDNSISIIQLNEDNSESVSTGHITTYMGIFVPNAGDFHVRIPGTPQLHLTQPVTNLEELTNAPVTNGDDSPTIVYKPDETNVDLEGLDLWTFHALVSEQDRQFHGGISTHLILRNNTLVGTIANTLATSLKDAYVLLPHSIVSVGDLGAGETQQVNLPLQSTLSRATSNGTSRQRNLMLADLIATGAGLPSSYFPYTRGGQPQNEFQRHVAFLSALSGNGFSYLPCGGPCTTHAILNKSTIVTTPPAQTIPQLANGSDPLLLPGASATLIGWTDQPLDDTNNITINDTHPHGFHDDMIQMPLNIGLSEPLNLPDILTGHVTAVQGYDLANVLPNIYMLSTGSMTFEFTLPSDAFFRSRGFTLTAPNTLSTGRETGINYFQVRLYNWQTASWDKITLNHYRFSTSNTLAYLGSDGRVLVQFTNQNASLGTLFLSKPSLSLQ
jgi:hypothetical protein